MAQIGPAFKNIIIPMEGVYSNDLGDSGGETVWGITRKYDRDWAGWKIVDQYKSKPNFPKNLDNEDILDSALAYYKKNYWDKMLLDQIQSQKLAQEMFDVGVNQGIGKAVLYLQKAANILNREGSLYSNISMDGVIGPKTVASANAAEEDLVVLLLNVQQGQRYIDICLANESQERFLRGWLKRLDI